MDTSIILDLPFRGTRDYIWSGDVMIALDSLARTWERDDYLRNIIFRKLSRRAVEARFIEPSTSCGTFQICHRGRERNGWLVETSRDVALRIPFDETPIRQATVTSSGRAVIPVPITEYHIFEQLIVLLKVVCDQVKSGHWLFTRAEFSGPLLHQASLEVSIEQIILGRGVMATIRSGVSELGRAQMVLP